MAIAANAAQYCAVDWTIVFLDLANEATVQLCVLGARMSAAVSERTSVQPDRLLHTYPANGPHTPFQRARWTGQGLCIPWLFASVKIEKLIQQLACSNPAALG